MSPWGQKRAAPETGPDHETTTAPAFSQNDGRACESLPPTLTGPIANLRAEFDRDAAEGGRALAKFPA